MYTIVLYSTILLLYQYVLVQIVQYSVHTHKLIIINSNEKKGYTITVSKCEKVNQLKQLRCR